MHLFGDVVIINFPFAEGQGSKRRPVMVIKDTGDNDLLVAKITSQFYSSRFDVSLHDWRNAGLLSSSIVRIHKIQTLHNSLVFAKIGRLSIRDLSLVKEKFLSLVE